MDEQAQVRDQAITLVRALLLEHLPEVLESNITTEAEDVQVSLEMLLEEISDAQQSIAQALGVLQRTHERLRAALREGPALQRLGERLTGRPRQAIAGVEEES